ncbi:MAG TPA: histidine kinase N-terminal domain-containing protein, partial [Propionibacteriaceae bacterium]|nr:histidine kinase N-terminal domain-containing protein [Propionibacteriaceae bacterium]
MLSLSHVLSAHSPLGPADRAWLKALVNEWHLLADASFSDLILWVPGGDEHTFWAGAQVRPTTGPTALEDDVVGDDVSYDAEHLVTAAFMSHEICETSDNALNAGIPVDVAAIPVIRHGECIAIVERHTNRMGLRAPGALEDAYLEIASILSDMLHRGVFPVSPPSDPSLSPKVGDGVVQLSPLGVIQYASPNAVSAYRRLGHVGDMEGEEFQSIIESVGLGLQPVGQSITADILKHQVRELDLENRDGAIRLRVIPLTSREGR